MIGFERKRGIDDLYFDTNLLGVQGDLDTRQVERLRRIRQEWNFYEGYHWEELPESDGPELTINYCRAFVDKFVSFELGKSFSISTHKNMEGLPVTEDGRTLFEYLEDVWEDNNQYIFCTEMGQMKSITGEAWIQVRYFDPEELNDPYNEYPNGRIQILLMPTSVVFPEYEPHQRGVLRRLTIMYQYETVVQSGILRKPRKEKRLFRQVWTNEECVTYDGNAEPLIVPNKYKVIPFIQINNLPLSGRNEGRSDLEDLIPMNTELNMKESNVSEIIDYHAAPITIVYGAKVGSLEKGANKLWGGLSKDARVENLELRSDLGSSTNYISSLRTAMCEVGGIPESALGGASAISNTSGVALQYINLPLVEKTRIKRMNTENGLERLNKLIILVSLLEGFITKPSSVSNQDFFWTEVKVPDTLPKDMLLELQQIQQEMSMGLESRENAMKRLGKENIEDLISIIDQDRKDHPDIYGVDIAKINSGMTNGQTPIEQVRVEATGQNGGGTE